MRLKSLLKILPVIIAGLSYSTGYAWSYEVSPKTTIHTISADSSGLNITIDCDYGGIWQTGNGGLTWEPISNRLSSYGRMGVRWQEFNSDFPMRRIFLTDSYEGKNLFYTNDNGMTWDFIRNEFNGPYYINGGDEAILSKYHENRVYLINLNNIAVSDDFCQTWESWEYSPYLYSILDFKEDIFCDSILYASAPYSRLTTDPNQFVNGFIKSTDSGRTWNCTEPIIDFHDEFGVERCDVYSFCQMSNGEFIVSVKHDHDEWLNNNFILLDTQENVIGRSGSELPIGFIAVGIIEDKEIHGRIYAWNPDTYCLYISTDYGRTWEKCSGGGFPSGWQRIWSVFQNTKSGDIYVASPSFGLYKSRDNAATWEKIPDPPIGPYGINRLYGEDVFIADRDLLNQWRFNSESNTYQKVPFLEDDEIQYSPRTILYSNEDTLVTFVEYYNRFEDTTPHFKMLHSYDSGENWVDVYDSPPFFGLWYEPVVYHDDSRHLIAAFCDDGHSVSYSLDLGRTWSSFTLDLPDHVEITPSMFAYENNIYVATWNGRGDDQIFRYDVVQEQLTDLEFPFQDPGINYTAMNVMGDSLFVLLQSAQFYIYDGSEWHQKTTQPGALSSGLAIIPSDPPVLASSVVRHHALYLSNDFGETWNYTPIEHEYASQNSWVVFPQYDSLRNRIWIETGIGPMWIDADELVNSMGVDPVEVHPVEMDVISCYPNPFNSSTRIKFNVTEPGDVKLKIYDITGRLVKECLNEYRNAGVHDYHLDASHLASGTYFIRFDMNHQVYVEKITLIK